MKRYSKITGLYSKDYRNSEPRFKRITTQDIREIYEIVCKQFSKDVSAGKINEGKIVQILDKPFESLYGSINIYDTIYKKAACYVEGIIRLHPFTDGNKRTAIFTATRFLTKNDHYTIFPLDTVKFLVSIAKNNFQEEHEINELIDHIADWLEERTSTTPIGYKKNVEKFLVPQIEAIKKLNRMEFSDHCLAWRLNDWFELEMHPEYKNQINEMLEFQEVMAKSIMRKLIKDKQGG